MTDLNITISKRPTLVRYFKIIYSAISIAMLFPCMVWALFIFIGYLKVGHLPIRGDIEVVSFNGIDRLLVLLVLYIHLFGGIFWASLTLINALLRLKAISWKFIAIGLIGIGLSLLISLSPQFEWLLD